MGKSSKHSKPKTAIEQRRHDEKKYRRSTTPGLMVPSARIGQMSRHRYSQQVQDIDDNARVTHGIKREDGEEAAADLKLEDDEEMLDEHIHLSIGHVIVDNPTHVYYQQHMSSIFNSVTGSADSAATLKAIITALRHKGRELGLEWQAQQAEKVLRESVLDSQGQQLSREVQDDSALVALNAGLLADRIHDDGFDATRFFRDVKKRLGLPAESRRSTPAPQLPAATDHRVRFGMPSSLNQSTWTQPFVQQPEDKYAPMPAARAPDFCQQAARSLPDHHGLASMSAAGERVLTTQELAKVRRGVDVLLDLKKLLREPLEEIRRITAQCFPAAKDLYIANNLAMRKPGATQWNDDSSLAKLYIKTEKMWSDMPNRDREAHAKRLSNTREGNWKKMAWRGVLQINGLRKARAPKRGPAPPAKPMAVKKPVATNDDVGLESAWNVSSDDDNSDDNSDSFSATSVTSNSKKKQFGQRRERSHGPQDLASKLLEYVANPEATFRPIGVYLSTANPVSEDKISTALDRAFGGYVSNGIRRLGDNQWLVETRSKEEARDLASMELRVGKHEVVRPVLSF